MFVNMATVRPLPGKERELADRMRTFSEAIKNQPGIIGVHVLSEKGTDALVGMSMWTDEESFNNAISAVTVPAHSQQADSLRTNPPLVRQFIEI
jgi:heme-degrading monooxygenase HmoA